MKACVYCSRNQKEESSPLLCLDIFNPLVVNSDRSDAERHKKSWTCTFMACLSVRLSGSLTHSPVFFFFWTGWRSVTSFFREWKLRLQERQTRASGVCVRALCCTLSLYNQSGCPPTPSTLLSMNVVAFGGGVGEAGVQISSFNSTHRSAAVCVVGMLGGVFVPPHRAMRCYVIEACQSILGIPLKFG